MILNVQEILMKQPHLFKSACMARFILVTGILLTVTSIVLLFQNNSSSKKMVLDTYGPLIEIACDQADQDIRVTLFTDSTGQASIFFSYNMADSAPFEEMNIWVNIIDLRSEFTWEIKSNAEAMLAKTPNGRDYIASSLDSESGTGRIAVFRLNCRKGYSTMCEIDLQINEQDFVVKDSGERIVRLPCVCPWIATYMDDLMKAGTRIDDLNWISKTVNGSNLYSPVLNIKASANNLIYSEPNLSVSSIFPKSWLEQDIICWDASMFFMPQVCYIDSSWQTLSEIKGTLASVFFGFGLSFIVLAVKDVSHMSGKRKRN